MRDEKLSGLLVENRRLQISPARGARGMRWWLTLGLIVWASLQAMSDIRKALVIDLATTERIVVATLSIGPTMAVIAVALGRRWWSLAGMAVSAALFVLDVAFLDNVRFGSVAPMLTLVAVVVAGAGGFRRDRRVTMICLAPVSYTHLDVYKRQSPRRAAPAPAPRGRSSWRPATRALPPAAPRPAARGLTGPRRPERR